MTQEQRIENAIRQAEALRACTGSEVVCTDGEVVATATAAGTKVELIQDAHVQTTKAFSQHWVGEINRLLKVGGMTDEGRQGWTLSKTAHLNRIANINITGARA